MTSGWDKFSAAFNLSPKSFDQPATYRLFLTKSKVVPFWSWTVSDKQKSKSVNKYLLVRKCFFARQNPPSEPKSGVSLDETLSKAPLNISKITNLQARALERLHMIC